MKGRTKIGLAMAVVLTTLAVAFGCDDGTVLAAADACDPVECRDACAVEHSSGACHDGACACFSPVGRDAVTPVERD